MATTPSGQISMSDINTALNASSSAQISFNDTGPRCIVNADSGAVSMVSMRGKQVASGVINVFPPSTSTAKGVTTTYYGVRSGNSATATLGNLTTISYFSNAASFAQLNGYKASNATNYGGNFNVQHSSAVSGTVPSFRVKVGSNPQAAFFIVTVVSNQSIFSTGTVLPTGFIGSADVYTSPNWVLST